MIPSTLDLLTEWPFGCLGDRLTTCTCLQVRCNILVHSLRGLEETQGSTSPSAQPRIISQQKMPPDTPDTSLLPPEEPNSHAGQLAVDAAVHSLDYWLAQARSCGSLQPVEQSTTFVCSDATYLGVVAWARLKGVSEAMITTAVSPLRQI